MFGNGFSREAIVCAHVLHAQVSLGIDRKVSRRVMALSNVPHRYYYHQSDGPITYLLQALDSLEQDEVACFFLLAASCSKEQAIEWADYYARVNNPAGVEIVVENSDDDPTRVDFCIHDPIANAWADRYGSLDGGTWECCDDENFVYDSTYWYPGLFEGIKKEGFRLNFSQYGEPDEHDLEVARHAADCEACQGDWHQGEKHLKEIDNG